MTKHFTRNATHEGYRLFAVRANRLRKDGTPKDNRGTKQSDAGFTAIMNHPGIRFEDWAAGPFKLVHLNWDLNNGSVIAIKDGENVDVYTMITAMNSYKIFKGL